MFRRWHAVLAIFLTLVFAATQSMAFGQMRIFDFPPKDLECVQKMDLAIEQFLVAEEEKSDNRFVRVFAVVAYNDLLCSGPEWMANIVIVATVDPRRKESLYGIFHFHFLPNGTFQSAAPIDEPSWKPVHPESGWWGDWCRLLSTVYPEDFAKQCKE